MLIKHIKMLEEMAFSDHGIILLYSFSANINSEPLQSPSVWKFRLPLNCWAENQILSWSWWSAYTGKHTWSCQLRRKCLLSASHFTMEPNYLWSSLSFQPNCKMFEDGRCYLYTNLSLAPDSVKIKSVTWIILFKIVS